MLERFRLPSKEDAVVDGSNLYAEAERVQVMDETGHENSATRVAILSVEPAQIVIEATVLRRGLLSMRERSRLYHGAYWYIRNHQQENR
jgi:hypothetical protein